MSLPNNIPIPFPIQFQRIPTSNYHTGRNGKIPTMIVIHVGEGSRQSIINTFQNDGTQKSSHLLVCNNGDIVQFVGTGDTAYGNGIVVNPISEILLNTQGNPNDYTISIENEGFSSSDIPEVQYESLAKLVKFLSQKWNIPLDRTHVIRHNEIEASKTCPGLIRVEYIIQKAKYAE